MRLEVISRHPPQGPARPAPLLFVHGAWHGAWCWDEHFLGYFAALGWDCHALSFRGHGQSQGTTRFALVRDYVEDLRAVIAQLPRPPILIGHSLGGLVVRKHIESARPPAAVLLAPLPVCGTTPLALRFARSHPSHFILANLTLDLRRVVRPESLCREMFFSDTLPEELFRKYYGLIGGESFLAYLDMCLSFKRPAPAAFPMLVLGAANDRVFTVDEIKKTAQAYGAECHIFDDMAHDMMLEPGWERVAKRMAGWLEGGAERE
ncbi:MAG: alpha/beta fold hydrolase [Thermodesulfobacteriota bacterium]